MEKRFQPVFWVCITQMQVKIYNIYLEARIAIELTKVSDHNTIVNMAEEMSKSINCLALITIKSILPICQSALNYYFGQKR